MEQLLEIKNLKVHFNTLDGVVNAVNGVNLSVQEGKTLGIVGESGCGKSVTVLSILRLIQEPPGKIAGGEIIFRGVDLLKLDKEKMQSIRGKEISMVFQDPMTSLNPVLTIGRQISEAILLHTKLGQDAAEARTVELLELVGIPNAKEKLSDFPHQFSGGMRQRVMIAISLALNPLLMIADEPTTALDVTIQAQIIELTKRIQERLGMAVVWITHDLGVIAELADNVAVMYAGRIVEEADVFQIFENPKHPYTIALLGSLPRIDSSSDEPLTVITGAPPDGIKIHPGCSFVDRCGRRVERCVLEEPLLSEVEIGHKVACWVVETPGRDE